MENAVSQDDLKSMQYMNEAVFSTLLLVFSIWRSSRSTLPSYNIFKGKLRSLGSLFILTSILFSTVYICTVTYLSTRVDIDKFWVELNGVLDAKYPIKYKSLSVDLVYVLNISLSVSRVLRMSAVFLLIGLWGPCAYSVFNSGERAFDVFRTNMSVVGTFVTKSIFNTSVITFSKIYAVLRTPLILYYYSRPKIGNEKTAVFMESFLLGSEVYLSVVLLMILKAKHGFLSEYKSLDSTNLLSFCLMLHGFFTYTVNTVAIPFEMTELCYQIQQSLNFGTRLVLDMLLMSMFCPIRDQLFDAPSDNKHAKNLEVTRISRFEDSGPIVQEIESIIEFEEKEIAK
ncbi:hypothetical protein HK407_11g16650 [Ordospora pajunii]|uniref:uncharacterized protein n=1 Tax=Ordospora pajunii TaxID=3039483 RepID=UPI0029527E6C|nr:uncharacterized protein HK407_11g16650 [Ordospora pajunii]KAH9410771.1 hypothetical protein HK407_11g16650 [Ordospora pajunii]